MKRHRRSFAVRVDEWLLPVFLVIVFLIGGASRPDVLSTVVLRPLAIVAIGLAVAITPIAAFAQQRFVIGIVVAGMALVTLHLIPLPYAVWTALPGRELLVRATEFGAVGKTWRPLTMVPDAGWNALFSLAIPLAVYCCWLASPVERQRILLPLLLCVGAASTALGVIQVATGQFYLYRLSTLGSPVGLFANRNHQAMFLTLLIPMMATYASLAKDDRAAKHRGLATIATGLAMIPILLVIGSRAGLLLGIVATVAALGLYRAPLRAGPRGKQRPIWASGLVIAATVILLATITAMFTRADAFARLLQTGGSREIRAENWRVVLSMIGDFMPWGSGAGSFVEVFQIGEPLSQIKYTYFNHAHNEPLEIALTLGLPGILVLLVGLAGWLWASIVLWQAGKTRDWRILFGQLGSSIMLILGLASLVDYPARTPSLAALLTLAALWMASGYERAKSDRSGRSGETRNER
jgi:O-antigen ligase